MNASQTEGMLRVRMHGRGGQGIKTGARVLGSACFLSGYEVLYVCYDNEGYGIPDSSTPRQRLEPRAPLPVSIHQAIAVSRKTCSRPGPPIGPPTSPPCARASRSIWRASSNARRSSAGRAWPLKEYVDGRVVHTKILHPRRPVEDYLERQGRFRHLFQPCKNEPMLRQIQAEIDRYWSETSADSRSE
jgi:hypothetical protein